MKQHDFIPLVTFRGWSEADEKFVFGALDIIGDVANIITNDSRRSFFVDKDSLGIYTGKDDKNGAPIFCGVAGAKYGSDILKVEIEDGTVTGEIGYIEASFCWVDNNDFMDGEPFSIPIPFANDYVIKSNQYEQYLKEQKCSK